MAGKGNKGWWIGMAIAGAVVYVAMYNFLPFKQALFYIDLEFFDKFTRLLYVFSTISFKFVVFADHAK